MRKALRWLFILFALLAVAALILVHLGNQVVRISTHPVEHQLMVYNGVTRAQLKDAIIVCSGHFGSGPVSGKSTVEMTIDSYTYPAVERKIVPFTVDHYWQGSGPAALDIARFNAPPLIGDYFDTYDSAHDKRFLLLLKKDTTGSSACQLVDIMNSWLSLPEHALENTSATSPEKIIEAACVDVLDSYATYQPPPAEKPGDYYMEEGQFEMLYQALDTLKSFGTSDEKTVQALEAIYTNEHLSSGMIVAHNYALDALNKIDPSQAIEFGLSLFEKGSLDETDRANFISKFFQHDAMRGYQLAVKLDAAGTLSAPDRQSFGRNLGSVIKASTYSQLDPAFIEKMIDGDDGAEHQVCDAFFQMRGDPRAIPWLGKFLYSSNPEIQFRAMDGLFYTFIQKEGKAKDFARPDSRQILHHADHDHPHGQPYPEEVVGPYKTWVKNWVEEHPGSALPDVSASK